jgi:hypothetical protein
MAGNSYGMWIDCSRGGVFCSFRRANDPNGSYPKASESGRGGRLFTYYNDVVHSLDAMHIERSEPERAQMTFGGHHHYGNFRLSWRSAGIRGGRCLSGKMWNSFLFSMSLAN